MESWLRRAGAAPRIGIAWRSRTRNAIAARVHPPLEAWRPIFAVPGLAFVCLQYGDVRSEIDDVAARFGAGILTAPGLDLFNDLEGALALATRLDLVVSTGTSAMCPGAAAGIETWQLQLRGDYLAFGEDSYLMWPRARGFVREPGEDWSRAMESAASALRRKYAGK
jgi:hypothetical protein